MVVLIVWRRRKRRAGRRGEHVAVLTAFEVSYIFSILPTVDIFKSALYVLTSHNYK